MFKREKCTNLLVDEGVRECEPALSGHDQRDDARAEAENSHEEARGAEFLRGRKLRRQVQLRLHQHQHAQQGGQVIPRQAPQHQLVLAGVATPAGILLLARQDQQRSAVAHLMVQHTQKGRSLTQGF
jgi:hypothetical protein